MSQVMQLSVIREDDTITHIALAGRLDVQGVNAIQDPFAFHTAGRRRPVLVDLSEVSFMASLGMGMLISAAKTLQRHGAKMVLVGPTDLVRRALEAAGIHHVVPIAAEESSALSLLA